jgi:hypothetical protein
MRRIALALVLAAAVAPSPTFGAAVDESEFRYERTLRTGGREQPVAFEPDGLLFFHAKPGFADLRVLDARGEQVPWRRLPERRSPPRSVAVLNSGRQGNAAVALVDVGRGGRVYDRMDLDIPDSGFVGRVTVFGADRRRGPYARLSATGIYDIAGARHARSTTAVFPPTDFRFLRLRATGVSRIAGATLSGTADRPRLVRRRARVLGGVARGPRQTVLVLDLGVPRVPISEVRVMAPDPVYDRRVVVEGSNDRRRFVVLAAGRIFRFPGSSSAPLSVASAFRYLRITIVNGEDEPLSGVRAEAHGPSHALLLEPGHPPPLRLLYGGPEVRAPDYEFARLPPPEPRTFIGPGDLGRERVSAAFDPPPDTRSLAERHSWAVEAALAAAALVVLLAGVLALRRRT